MIDHRRSAIAASFFAVGGGGLCSGSGGWLKSFNPDIEIIGVSPEKSPVMYESVKANKMLEMETFQTLADTCAGGVDLDTITLPLLQKYADQITLLTEKQIAGAYASYSNIIASWSKVPEHSV